jgi:glycerophosphoryl diester phosphodiesterase
MILLVAPAPSLAEDFPFFGPVQPPRRVQVMSRRGAGDRAPENTLAAVELAIADGFEWVRVDVRLSRDGRHALIHDANLERTVEAEGPVDARSLAELKRLDAGSKFARRFAGQAIPTLDEALKTAKGRVNLALACHRIDAAGLVREVLEAGMERQVVISADLDVLRSIRAATGGDRLALMPKWRPSDGLEPFADLRPAAVEVAADDGAPELVRTLHAKGWRIMVRAIGVDDRPPTWDRLIDAGVDWLETDVAEEVLAREVLRRVAGRPRVKVAHHRGANRYAPENTLPAYEKSIRLGADYVEFDIRTTRDGVPMLLHDGTLNRTTNARGPIRDLGAAEVARLDAGAWFGRPFAGTPVPTLDAFLKVVAGKVELYVDAKDIAPEALVEVLRSHGLIEHSIVYQGVEYLARLRAIEPKLRRMPPLGDPSQVDPIADRLAPYAFDTRWGILSKPLIDRCHARGIQVFSDAIGLNESVDRYRRAIADGIDLIQTDHPVRVLRAIELIDAANRPTRD